MSSRQLLVGRDVAAQIASGNHAIFGVMVESHLKAGRQDLRAGNELVYGLSITDAWHRLGRKSRSARHTRRWRAAAASQGSAG